MTQVSRLLRARALERPDAIAFIEGAGGHRLHWRDLVASAARWERLARERCLGPRRRVALVVDEPLTFSAAYLGCLAANLTVVPLDPRASAAELAAAMARLRVDVLVTDSADAPPAGTSVDAWTVDLNGPSAGRAGPRGPRPSDTAALRPAALLATSGTTGEPKGIPLSEPQLMRGAERVAAHHGLGPEDRGYTPLPLFHVNAQVVGLLAILVAGGSLVVDARFDRAEYWARVAEWRPTWLNTVPAILAALADAPAPPAAAADRLRFARSASAPLSLSVLERFQCRTGVGVLETYGMTEAAGQITANPLEAGARRPGSVGLPVGVDLRVTTPEGGGCSAGEVGLVRLHGDAVVSNYLDLAEAGVERARPARDRWGWLPTGDLGFCDEAGFLHLVGREDDVINRGGEKFHPQEVEGVLLSHGAVTSAAVVAAPHPRLGQVAVAFVALRPGASPALVDELRLLCDQRLARYKRPVDIHVATALPMGPTGKVRRRELRAALAA